MTIPTNVKCDRADCKYRADMVWCFDYPKYHYEKCPLYHSDTANQERQINPGKGIEHNLTKETLDVNRGLEE